LKAELSDGIPLAVPAGLTAEIEIVNRSTAIGDSDVERALVGLQAQITRDFYPVWGLNAILKFVGKNGVADADKWQLVILDTPDQAGLLGYHDRTKAGKPLGKVFALTDSAYKSSWTVSASHELMEMLVDPDINLCAAVLRQGKAQFYAYECADACEGDGDGYVVEGVLVSDFVFPAWFETFREPGTRFDWQRKINKPLQTLPGSYLQYFDVVSGLGWQQTENPDGGAVGSRSVEKTGGDPAKSLLSRYATRAAVGSRRERRRIDRDRWVNSGDSTGGPYIPGRLDPGDTSGGPVIPEIGPAGPLARREGFAGRDQGPGGDQQGDGGDQDNGPYVAGRSERGGSETGGPKIPVVKEGISGGAVAGSKVASDETGGPYVVGKKGKNRKGKNKGDS
jgi:hypothetical protein